MTHEHPSTPQHSALSTQHSICVFCGSGAGVRPIYADAGRALGEALARRRLRLVYGGGLVGLMGVVADAALAAGGEVVGVIPRALLAREVGHGGIGELRIVETMHERKALMAELAGGFIALPGGFGTLDELCEMLTWAQLGIHQKPVALLNVVGYFAPLLAFLDHALGEGFLRPEHHRLLLVDNDHERLLDRMAAYSPPTLPAWADRDDV